MKDVPGRNGGTIKRMEKGDPSPNKGKHRESTSSMLAKWTREGRERLTRKNEHTTFETIFDMPVEDVLALAKNNKLPVGIVVEIRGWFDKRNGADNLRKSKEKIFGKPTEHVDAVVENRDATNPVMNMSFEEVQKLYNDIQKRKAKTAKNDAKTR